MMTYTSLMMRTALIKNIPQIITTDHHRYKVKQYIQAAVYLEDARQGFELLFIFIQCGEYRIMAQSMQ